MTEFIPPVSSLDVAEVHSCGEGDYDRATLIVVDDAGSEFTLTIEAAAQHDLSVLQGLQEGEFTEEDETVEPVFIVPGTKIDPEDLGRIIATPAELLIKYLVEQDPVEKIAS